jgi:hypothetical protein
MRHTFVHPLFLVALALLLPLVAAPSWASDTDDILAAAESVFQAMQKGDSVRLWKGLSEGTQRSILRDILKATEKTGGLTEDTVRREMEAGGEIARSYWSGYLTHFDPKTILDESRWIMGEIRKDRAEIVLRYKKSKNDAILKMYREQGAWKVGLDESFSTRK